MVDQPGAVVGCAFTVPNPFDDAAEVQVIGGPAGRRVGLQSAASSFDEAQRADPLPRSAWVMPTHNWASPCRHNSRSSAGPAFQRASNTSWAENGLPSASNSCAAEIVSTGGSGSSGTGSTRDAAVRQRATEPIPRTRLPSSSLRISIPIASVTHTRKLPGCVTPTGPREDCGGRPTATAERRTSSGISVPRKLRLEGLRDHLQQLVDARLAGGKRSSDGLRTSGTRCDGTFDTADSYANTMAETVLGEALKGERRESLEILTKVFWSTGPGGPNDIGLSRKHIMESINGSLSRLQTDYVDLYQAHRFDHETPLDETMQAFADVVRMGKALYIGVGEWTAQQIQDGHDLAEPRHPPDLQPAAVLHAVAGDRGRRRTGLCLARHLADCLLPHRPGCSPGKYRPGEQLPTGSRATDEKGGADTIKRWMRDDVLKRVQQLAARRGGRTLDGAARCRLGTPERQRRQCDHRGVATRAGPRRSSCRGRA